MIAFPDDLHQVLVPADHADGVAAFPPVGGERADQIVSLVSGISEAFQAEGLGNLTGPGELAL